MVGFCYPLQYRFACPTAQELTFYGYLKIRVLGGVVNIDSFAMKPGERGVTVCVPQGIGTTAITMEAMDPALTVSRSPLTFSYVRIS